MKSPSGERSPPPLEHIVRALSAYECPYCARADFKANTRQRLKRVFARYRFRRQISVWCVVCGVWCVVCVCGFS
jgi:hypothetical protein